MDAVAAASPRRYARGRLRSLFVARAFLREPVAEADELESPPTPPRVNGFRREEERDRALAALKELEFDHRTGKVSDEDYRAALPGLRTGPAEALRALDTPRDIDPEREGERRMSDCPTCGAGLPADARFCPACGREVPEEARGRLPKPGLMEAAAAVLALLAVVLLVLTLWVWALVASWPRS